MTKIKDHKRIILMLKQQTQGLTIPSEFKGQTYIPHNYKNNRKTKKSKK